MMPGEGERLRITGAICGDGSWAYLVDGPALSKAFVRDYVPASRLEAAESELEAERELRDTWRGRIAELESALRLLVEAVEAIPEVGESK